VNKNEIPVLSPATQTTAVVQKRSWAPLFVSLLVLVGGIGGWMFYTRSLEAKLPKPPTLAPPIYVALDPPFVVNFETEALVRFLQITVQVMTRDPLTADLVRHNDPVVRNDLLLLFANQRYEQIATREGKERLRDEALAAVRRVVESSGGRPELVEAVYFTSFVMQ
jgi:Flagellar basal body-associated protein